MQKTNESGVFKHILFCTDFSENADFAFHFALAQATRFPGSRLTILHVVPAPEAQFWNTYLYEADDVDNKAASDMDRRIHDSYLSHIPEGIEVHVEIVAGGTVHEQILDYAQQHAIDLLIIGRQGHSSIGKVLFGNETEKIVRKAKCAAMVVPMAYQEAKSDS